MRWSVWHYQSVSACLCKKIWQNHQQELCPDFTDIWSICDHAFTTWHVLLKELNIAFGQTSNIWVSQMLIWMKKYDLLQSIHPFVWSSKGDTLLALLPGWSCKCDTLLASLTGWSCKGDRLLASLPGWSCKCDRLLDQKDNWIFLLAEERKER